MDTTPCAHQLLLDAWHPLLNESNACLLLHGCLEQELGANVALKSNADRRMDEASDQIVRMINDLRTGLCSADSLHEEYLDLVTEYWQSIDDALSETHDVAADEVDRIVRAVAAELSPMAASIDWTEYCLAELKHAALRPYESCADELAAKRQRSLADLWNMQAECRLMMAIVWPVSTGWPACGCGERRRTHIGRPLRLRMKMQ